MGGGLERGRFEVKMGGFVTPAGGFYWDFQRKRLNLGRGLIIIEV